MVATVTLKKMWQGMAGGARRTVWSAALILAVLWLIPGCPPPPGTEKLTKDVETLKTEVAALKEKLNQLEANQKLFMEMLRAKAAAPASPFQAPAAPGAGVDLPGMPPAPGQTPLTLDELFKNQNQLLGTRVMVKGLPGPVMMHKKTLFMSGPGGGMVEVIYGNLQDKKQIERLTSQAIDTPITVTGLLSAAPGQAKNQVRLIIMADSVEF